jgi:hypothetical protein
LSSAVLRPQASAVSPRVAQIMGMSGAAYLTHISRLPGRLIKADMRYGRRDKEGRAGCC